MLPSRISVAELTYRMLKGCIQAFDGFSEATLERNYGGYETDPPECIIGRRTEASAAVPIRRLSIRRLL